MWTLLVVGELGYRLERRFAAYDVARMLARLEAIHHPADEHIRTLWART